MLKLTYDYPLLRILLSAALFFFSVYMMRVAKIGVVFFLVGIVVIYVQSFVDMTDQAEVLVRLVLWVWVAVNYPIALTLLINTVLLPAEPVQQLESGNAAANCWRLTPSLAQSRAGGGPVAGPITRDSIQTGMLTLQKLLRSRRCATPTIGKREAFHLARVATVSRLYRGSGRTCPRRGSDPRQRVVPALRADCRALDEAIRAGEPFTRALPPADRPGHGMPGALRTR